jgi:hypothetical protein
MIDQGSENCGLKCCDGNFLSVVRIYAETRSVYKKLWALKETSRIFKSLKATWKEENRSGSSNVQTHGYRQICRPDLAHDVATGQGLVSREPYTAASYWKMCYLFLSLISPFKLELVLWLNKYSRLQSRALSYKLCCSINFTWVLKTETQTQKQRPLHVVSHSNKSCTFGCLLPRFVIIF